MINPWQYTELVDDVKAKRNILEKKLNAEKNRLYSADDVEDPEQIYIAEKPISVVVGLIDYILVRYILACVILILFYICATIYWPNLSGYWARRDNDTYIYVQHDRLIGKIIIFNPQNWRRYSINLRDWREQFAPYYIKI